MSADEIRTIVEAMSREGLQFPYWQYAIAFMAALLGAFGGAYLKRKGEDHAAKESFESLREQMRKTTQETESIRQSLSEANWRRQQEWTIREQRYMTLVACLTKFKISLEDRSEYYMEPGSSHDTSIERSDHFMQLVNQGAQAVAALREMRDCVEVFLSVQAIAALDKLRSDCWHTSMDAACTAEYVEKALEHVREALTIIVSEARAELRKN